MGSKYQIPEKLLSRRILDKEAGLIYNDFKQTLTYMLDNQDTDFYRYKCEFQWAERDFMT